jgi:perosamine synthetase
MSFFVKNFEQAMAEASEKKYAFSFWKGRVALSAILFALEIKPGDEIILPGFTCVVVANSIIFCGAKPIYVDINEENFNIDVNKIESKITSKTKAIIIQSFLNIPINELDRLSSLAKKYNLKIIGDYAQASVNQINSFNSDVAFVSTQWSKIFTTGLGGTALTNNEQIAEKLRIYQNEICVHPSLKETVVVAAELIVYHLVFGSKFYWTIIKLFRWLTEKNIIVGSSSNDELVSSQPPHYAKRTTAIQALVGLLKIKNLKDNINHRRLISELYFQNLRQELLGNNILYNSGTAYLRFPVLVNNKDHLLTRAEKLNLELGDWFLSPLHPNKANLEKAGYQSGACFLAEKISQEIINLPTHDRINKEQAIKIINFINKEAEKIK